MIRLARRLGSFRDGRKAEWALAAVLLLLGTAWRIAWLWRLPPDEFYAQGEAINAARSLALNHGLADAFGPGTGATAHLNPVMPWIASLIYSFAGVDSTTSLWILSLLSLLLCFAAALMYMAAAAEMGVPAAARLVFLGIFMLVPLYAKSETVDFRHWEGGLASFLGALLLLLIVRSHRTGEFPPARMVAAALVAALLFFISPPLGLAGYAASLVLVVRQRSAPLFGRALLISIVAAVAVLGPWTYRNWVTFDRFMPLRSNFGLEFALGMYPQAVTTTDEAATRKARFAAIHPIAQPNGAEFLKSQGGELAYSDKLGASTWAWAFSHPGDFARLSVRHVKQFYFPPQWFWGEQSRGTTVKQGVMWAISLLGLIGALMALGVWGGATTYVASMALVPALVYALVQPNLRYHYIVQLPLLMLGVTLAAWLARSLQEQLLARRMPQEAGSLP